MTDAPNRKSAGRAVARVFNALTALLQLVVFLGSATLSYAVLPVFAVTGAGRVGVAVLIGLACLAAFWVFCRIWDVFTDGF